MQKRLSVHLSCLTSQLWRAPNRPLVLLSSIIWLENLVWSEHFAIVDVKVLPSYFIYYRPLNIWTYSCTWMNLLCRPHDVYHVTVMPCYDKKLEAVRDDFVFSVEDKDVTEVDSVLTTGEVLDLIQVTDFFPCPVFWYAFKKLWEAYTIFMLVQSRSVDFKTLEESPMDRLWVPSVPLAPLGEVLIEFKLESKISHYLFNRYFRFTNFALNLITPSIKSQ